MQTSTTQLKKTRNKWLRVKTSALRGTGKLAIHHTPCNISPPLFRLKRLDALASSKLVDTSLRMCAFGV